MPRKTLLNYLIVLLVARIMSITSKLYFFFMDILSSGIKKYIRIPIAVNYSTHRGTVVSFFPVPSVLRMSPCLWACKHKRVWIHHKRSKNKSQRKVCTSCWALELTIHEEEYNSYSDLNNITLCLLGWETLTFQHW